jgi:hypothetical protein
MLLVALLGIGFVLSLALGHVHSSAAMCSRIRQGAYRDPGSTCRIRTKHPV